MCTWYLTNELGELLELVIGHARSCATPQFLAHGLHGRLNPGMDISVTDDVAEFVIPVREHAP